MTEHMPGCNKKGCHGGKGCTHHKVRQCKASQALTTPKKTCTGKRLTRHKVRQRITSTKPRGSASRGSTRHVVKQQSLRKTLEQFGQLPSMSRNAAVSLIGGQVLGFVKGDVLSKAATAVAKNRSLPLSQRTGPQKNWFLNWRRTSRRAAKANPYPREAGYRPRATYVPRLDRSFNPPITRNLYQGGDEMPVLRSGMTVHPAAATFPEWSERKALSGLRALYGVGKPRNSWEIAQQSMFDDSLIENYLSRANLGTWQYDKAAKKLRYGGSNAAATFAKDPFEFKIFGRSYNATPHKLFSKRPWLAEGKVLPVIGRVSVPKAVETARMTGRSVLRGIEGGIYLDPLTGIFDPDKENEFSGDSIAGGAGDVTAKLLLGGHTRYRRGSFAQIAQHADNLSKYGWKGADKLDKKYAAGKRAVMMIVHQEDKTKVNSYLTKHGWKASELQKNFWEDPMVARDVKDQSRKNKYPFTINQYNRYQFVGDQQGKIVKAYNKIYGWKPVDPKHRKPDPGFQNPHTPNKPPTRIGTNPPNVPDGFLLGEADP